NTITSNPAVYANADGRLEVFARGADNIHNALWHIWQTAPNSGWSDWQYLGNVLTSDPAVYANADGRLEVFARGSDKALWHIWQKVASGSWSSSWSGWTSLGAP
ncbi:hypothetical protein SAMN02982990_01699, partial [Photorhabdus luminescens]